MDKFSAKAEMGEPRRKGRKQKIQVEKEILNEYKNEHPVTVK